MGTKLALWDKSDTFEAVGGLNLQQLVNKKNCLPVIYCGKYGLLSSLPNSLPLWNYCTQFGG